MAARRRIGAVLVVLGVTGLLVGVVGFSRSAIAPPATADQMLALGEERLRGGDLHGAAEWFHKAADAAPTRHEPRLAAGKVRELNGDIDAAIDDYRDAAELAPAELRPALALARTLGRAGRVREAEHAIAAARRRHPTAPEPLLLLVALRLDAGDSAGARAALETFERDHPTDVRGPLRAAAVREAEGEDAAALSAYRRAVQVDGSSVAAWEGVGRLAAGSGAFDEAERAYRRVVELRPADASALTVLATIVERRERWADAERLFRRALALLDGAEGEARRTRALASTGLGTTLLALGRRDDAYVALAAALTDDRDQPEALWALAPIYIDRGEHDLAARALERIVAHRADVPVYWVLVGRAEAGAGRWLEARAAFQRALELDERSTVARRWFGIALRALGAYRAAALALEEVVASDPSDGVAALNLAIARGQLGEVARARDAFEAARRLLPESPDPDAYEAHLMLATGQVDEALSLAESAVAIDGANPAALEVLARVAAARGDRSRALELARRARDAAVLDAHRRYLDDLARSVDEGADAAPDAAADAGN